MSGERLQRAVSGLVSGEYEVTVARQEERHVAGYAKNGKEYGVVLTDTMTACSCPDSMYRHVTCKHQAMLALYVLRYPEEEEHKPNLKLARVRSTDEQERAGFYC